MNITLNILIRLRVQCLMMFVLLGLAPAVISFAGCLNEVKLCNSNATIISPFRFSKIEFVLVLVWLFFFKSSSKSFKWWFVFHSTRNNLTEIFRPPDLVLQSLWFDVTIDFPIESFYKLQAIVKLWKTFEGVIYNR